MIYYVSQKGNGRGNGTEKEPFATIGQAAEIAKAGDMVIIDDGVYREWVDPKNGGLGNNLRITYIAKKGTHPIISGAEVISGWKHERGNIWSCSVNREIFKEYDPYEDEIYGDWFNGFGRVHHTGELFLDGVALYEAASLASLDEREEKGHARWFACVKEDKTIFYGEFPDIDPNRHLTEISVRPFCFFPSKTGLNYITVSGLTFCKVATQWAPPTAFQPAAVGPNWSKGWIIENCKIHDSKCCGVSLGKRADEKDNAWSKDPSKGGAQTYTETICYNIHNGWDKETIGGHIVRNNEIYNCGQTGIVGCMGGAFSDIIHNHVHHINDRGEFGGAEMAGVKLHVAIDTVIEQNCFHNCINGLWLDWEAQGAAVRRNIFYENNQDLFIEVCHGPCTVENNLMLSKRNFLNVSQGTACLHNLFAGELFPSPDTGRFTLYHQPHSTALGGVIFVYGGDDCIANNIFIGRYREHPLLGTGWYEKYSGTFEKKSMEDDKPTADMNKTLPVRIFDNVYYNGAETCTLEKGARFAKNFEAKFSISWEDGHCIFSTNLYEAPVNLKTGLITTDLLGKAFESGQAFENRDGSPIIIDTDFLGEKRTNTPSAGPFEAAASQFILF